ncbi:hypothetical protein BC938DRAFT_482227 [Jimgerdemannia flammicorona]|uniref:USP domain-containing protein n=1 Tax=Jimgerdemannia flammicorona TaxID=994334 RepID=A0A433QEC9_9FUNG|nr:hypothetical protein BC938DRAFT_482227 [Jimgerdemannia flammicorona]
MANPSYYKYFFCHLSVMIPKIQIECTSCGLFGPHHGHYQTVIRSNGQWLLFDDDVVQPIEESDIQKYFGDLPGTGSGYVLFYQSVNLDLNSLGLTSEPWTTNNTTISQDGVAATEASGTAVTVNGERASARHRALLSVGSEWGFGGEWGTDPDTGTGADVDIAAEEGEEGRRKGERKRGEEGEFECKRERGIGGGKEEQVAVVEEG